MGTAAVDRRRDRGRRRWCSPPSSATPTPSRPSKVVGIALIALSLVPLVGFGGQLSLCQMSFAGIGAVVMAHLGQGGDPWRSCSRRVVVRRSSGAIVALPALRLSGIDLALATAAFAVFLDRWVFLLPTFDARPVDDQALRAGHRRRSTRSTSRASTPPTGRRSSSCSRGRPRSRYLLVVAVRRSGFGHGSSP